MLTKTHSIYSFIFYVYCLISLSSVRAQEEGKKNEDGTCKLRIYTNGFAESRIQISQFKGYGIYSSIENLSLIGSETQTWIIPKELLPGEFKLKFTYRCNETNEWQTVERIIFLVANDLEVTFSSQNKVTQECSITLSKNDIENSLFTDFLEEKEKIRKQLSILTFFLGNYEDNNSRLYRIASREYKEQQNNFNHWLEDKKTENSKTFISHLVSFYFEPSINWRDNKEVQQSALLNHYFDRIDLNDTLILRTSLFTDFMNRYMELVGRSETDFAIRDSLFILAGQIACEKAKMGHPKVYGWMVDYFFVGYEALQIKKGVDMLFSFASDVKCSSTYKNRILNYNQSIMQLSIGVKVPDFVLNDTNGNEFDFHFFTTGKPTKLLVFWSADCEHCLHFVNELNNWLQQPSINEMIDVVLVSVDETEAEVSQWRQSVPNFPEWQHLLAKNTFKNSVLTDYNVQSTPSIFLVDGQSNLLTLIPENFNQLKQYFEKNK